MSVNYSTSVLTSRLQQVINAIDAVAGGGFLRLLDSGGNILSSLRFYVPSGTASAGVLTFQTSIIDVSAARTGTAIAARCDDGNGNTVISGLLVNGTAPDITLSPTNAIVAGQVVVITAASITGH